MSSEEFEKYVCMLYGKPKLKKVNTARTAIFREKYRQKNKIIDLALLPPCQKNLTLHLQRSNFVAYDMRHSNQLRPEREEHEQHGFTAEGKQIWTEQCVPQVIEDVLIRAEEESAELASRSEVEDVDHDDTEDSDMDDIDVQTEDFS